LAVVVVVQQIESLLVSPHVMGRKLSISPLTVTLLVLVSGRMAGLFGMILALPAFVILKIIILQVYQYLRPQKE
ncbi:MAG TPA: AI-2E family transporter, partial [Firmicutes bacterium]|nr:AI-2E family transporter [Bacillota bacterium]